jgi:hypothetical protein
MLKHSKDIKGWWMSEKLDGVRYVFYIKKSPLGYLRGDPCELKLSTQVLLGRKREPRFSAF